MKKYVKVCSPHECRNFARLGALYWRFASRGASPYTEWRLYGDADMFTYGRYDMLLGELLDPAHPDSDEAWQEQMDKYDASILVESDEE